MSALRRGIGTRVASRDPPSNLCRSVHAVCVCGLWLCGLCTMLCTACDGALSCVVCRDSTVVWCGLWTRTVEGEPAARGSGYAERNSTPPHRRALTPARSGSRAPRPRTGPTTALLYRSRPRPYAYRTTVQVSCAQPQDTPRNHFIAPQYPHLHLVVLRRTWLVSEYEARHLHHCCSRPVVNSKRHRGPPTVYATRPAPKRPQLATLPSSQLRPASRVMDQKLGRGGGDSRDHVV
jgi:hypothetical protein